MTTRSEAEALLAHHLLTFRRINLDTIDATIEKARGVVVDWQVDQVAEARAHALSLLKAGKFDAAMEAGQALFNAAHGLHNALEVFPLLKRDAKRQAGTRKPRRPELQVWINKEVAKGGETAKELYQRAPQWVKDEVEIDRFVKRVTQARKLVASK